MLKTNTTPAERARGCVFSELFRDAASVARNGGVATGSPAIDKGVTLDGSTQYVEYLLDARGVYTAAVSCVLEFTPDFQANDNVRRFMFEIGSGVLSVSKRETNQLWVVVGGGTPIGFPLLRPGLGGASHAYQRGIGHGIGPPSGPYPLGRERPG